MSEIYAPGSIAGAQGPAGPAGSQGSVMALASAVLPSFVGMNLFDQTKISSGCYLSPSTGLPVAAGGMACSGLMFCPGATSMIANVPIDLNNGAVCLYDANGNFISSLGMSYYTGLGGLVNVGPGDIGIVAFPLPGTQVYVGISWEGRFGTAGIGGAYAAGPATAQVFATITGAATLPGTYQAAGVDTVADVNAKDAVVAANAAANLAGSLTTAIGMVANSLLPSPVGGGRNVFDVAKAVANTVQNTDGTLGTASGAHTIMVYAPHATGFITNLAIRGVPNGAGVCLYDALGNFIEDISTTTLAADFTHSNTLVPNTVYALPGTQTYIRFNFDLTAASATQMFFAGTAASPCPASLPAGQPFAGSQPVNIRTASQLGCALDSNLSTGGGTDNTALLNAFLATASAAKPIKLVLDGPVLTSGLVIAAPGHTTIEGIGSGSGLVTTSGATASIIIAAQGGGAYNVTPPAQASAYVALRNFTITPAGSGGFAGIMLADCTDIEIENVLVTGTTAGDDFSITLSNVSRVRVAGCTFITTGYGHDGVHCNGICADVAISDCFFSTGDDAIALNAPEGYGGDISRVTVTNCRFLNCLTVMRIYTSIDPAAMPTNNTHKVRDVVVSNCSGTVTSVCFNLGITAGEFSTSTADQLQDLTVSNCVFAAPQGLALLLAPIGSLVFRGVGFIPTGAASLIFANFSGVGELMLDDVRVIRNGDGSSVLDAFVNIYGGVTMDRVSLVNCRAVDEEGSSYAAHTSLIDNNGGSISALRLEAVDLTHIAALFSSAGTSGIALLRGGGVLGTGAQVPDSVMDSNALYLSSNASGAPSIKVGGTAKRLTLA